MSDSYNPQRTKRGLDLATAADLGDLLHELTHSKEGRKLVASAIKKVKPDSPHAEAFKDVEIEDRFDEFKREQEAERVKSQQSAILAEMNSKRQRLINGDEASGRKYSEDDVQKIEALMTRKGITDYDDGAVLYAATLPPVNPKQTEVPPNVHGSTWEFPQFEKYAKDPTKAARDEAHTVIGEFMRKRA